MFADTYAATRAAPELSDTNSGTNEMASSMQAVVVSLPSPAVVKERLRRQAIARLDDSLAMRKALERRQS